MLTTTMTELVAKIDTLEEIIESTRGFGTCLVCGAEGKEYRYEGKLRSRSMSHNQQHCGRVEEAELAAAIQDLLFLDLFLDAMYRYTRSYFSD